MRRTVHDSHDYNSYEDLEEVGDEVAGLPTEPALQTGELPRLDLDCHRAPGRQYAMWMFPGSYLSGLLWKGLSPVRSW